MLGIDAVAIQKAGAIPGWFPYLYDTKEGGIQITGSMTRPISRGPRKGEMTWNTAERRITVFVTREELIEWDRQHPGESDRADG